MSSVLVPISAIDDLNQIRDELRVVWVALSNDGTAAEFVGEIGEHVNGLGNRIADVCRRMEEGRSH